VGGAVPVPPTRSVAGHQGVRSPGLLTQRSPERVARRHQRTDRPTLSQVGGRWRSKTKTTTTERHWSVRMGSRARWWENRSTAADPRVRVPGVGERQPHGRASVRERHRDGPASRNASTVPLNDHGVRIRQGRDTVPVCVGPAQRCNCIQKRRTIRRLRTRTFCPGTRTYRTDWGGP